MAPSSSSGARAKPLGEGAARAGQLGGLRGPEGGQRHHGIDHRTAYGSGPSPGNGLSRLVVASRQRGKAAAAAQHDQPHPVPADLRRARPAVVGRGHRGAVGAGHADGHQVAPRAAAAAGRRPAGRSIRTPGRPPAPAPSRRPVGRRRAAAREVSATIGCSAPYSAGRSSSVMPASSTTSRGSRSRTWSTRPTSQPDAATTARPGSMASRAGRASGGDRVELGRAPPPRTARSPAPSRPCRSPPGSRSPMSSVSKSGRPPRWRTSSRSIARNAVRHASTAPSCEPTWRWSPRQRSGPSGAAARRDDLRQLVREHAELGDRAHPPPGRRGSPAAPTG